MENEIINKINNDIIRRYFGKNNLEFFSETTINGYNKKEYLLLDNSKTGIFAHALEEIYIIISVKVEENDSKMEKTGDFYVSFSYKHIDGGRNGCNTNIKNRFRATRLCKDSEIDLRFI